MKKLFCICLIMIFNLVSASFVFANVPQDEWRSYIDGTIGKPSYYLFEQAISMYFNKAKNYRALDLGAGAGNEDVNLLMRGWNVQSIDLSSRSGEVITERAKELRGHFQFQQGDFSSVTLTNNYDLVMSFFALPFGNKNDLGNLFAKLSQHMNTGAVFAANFFGEQHDFVKKGEAYGVTKEELLTYLTANHFKLTFFLNRIYDQKDFAGVATHWDVLDVIAVKN